VQFRQLARIVGRICNSESWPFLYLTGDRNLDDRSKVIARFRDDKNIKILIAGLKCGGLGYVSLFFSSSSALSLSYILLEH
jgi:SNF2 family DNA or RNA helicase